MGKWIKISLPENYIIVSNKIPGKFFFPRETNV